MTPCDGLASWANVASDRSMTRPVLGLWRSSMVQVTEAPVARSVTVITVPKGMFGVAHVPAGAWYHEAWPVSLWPEPEAAVAGAAVVVVVRATVVVLTGATRTGTVVVVGCGAVVVVVVGVGSA